MEALPREPVVIDEFGRLTIPKRFREALGLPNGRKYPIWVEAYYNDKGECKSLIIRK